MTRTSGLCVAASLCAVLASPPPALTAGAAQPRLRAPRPFRSGVALTTVTATVTDADGGLVTGLTREDFEIFEDGDRQPVSQFTSERVPVSVALLLDVSDSMHGPRLTAARAAVSRFLIDLLDKSDESVVLAFNHQPHLLTGWTQDAPAIAGALEALKPSGATAAYDAVAASLPMIERRSRPRGAVVLISDGADTASDLGLRDVRAALLRSDAFVYAIAIDPPGTHAINTRVNAQALRELTDQSGGRTEVVHSPDDLVEATGRIAHELNHQYLLGYISSHPADGQYHSIRVRVRGAGYRVRARNGYIAAPPE